MSELALPPPAPGSDRELSIGIKWSVTGHLALAIAILLKSLVFPGTVTKFIPTLRVDLVDLPDALKTEKLKPLDVAKLERELKQADNAAKEIKKVPIPTPAEPSEMVKNPVAKPNHAKKIKNILERMRALDKIDDEEQAAEAKPVKGNILSKGSSRASDARENGEPNYLDSLRAHLQDNWSLPVWLSRQNLVAQIQLFIDAQGRLQSYRFMRTSGNTQFDEAVKRTLQQSQPFPKPPRDLAISLAVNGILVGFPL